MLGERSWRRVVSEPSDAIKADPATAAGMGFEGGVLVGRAGPNAPEGERIPGAWDHEHCEICMGKVGAGGEAAGYRCGPGWWVCEACYRDCVEPKSLGFIPHT